MTAVNPIEALLVPNVPSGTLPSGTNPVVTHDDTRLTSQADLALTTAGKGASLVGIQDAAGIITGTTVETALAEVAQFEVDLGSTANAKGASKVGIEDALGVITATTVEGALAEIAGSRYRVEVPLTIAEANAGKTLLADALVPAGKKVRIEGVQFLVSGATAWTPTASSTQLTISDSAGTALCDAKLAGLTGNALLLESDPTNLVLLAAAVAGGATADKGLTIQSDGTHDVAAGSDLTVIVWGRLL